jgi:cytochrome b subunit of formate dehydrogenase
MAKIIERYPDRTRLNHWAVALLFICAGLTGLAIFHPSMYFFSALFGGGSWTRILHPFFPIVVRRIAVLIHAIAATVLILSVIIHVYAAIWVKGSVQAMTRGTVSEKWARRHHLLWYRKISGEK